VTDDHHPSALAQLGHDLRTPLTAIIGFADAMRAQTHGPLGERYALYAEMIHQAGLKMLEMVDGLTDQNDAP